MEENRFNKIRDYMTQEVPLTHRCGGHTPIKDWMYFEKIDGEESCIWHHVQDDDFEYYLVAVSRKWRT